MLLDRLFDNLALTVDPFATCIVSTGWRLRLGELASATLHFVLEGEGDLRLGSDPPVPLRPCTLAVVPDRRGHALQGPGTGEHETVADAATPGPRPLQFVAGADGDRRLLIACGHVGARYGGAFGVFERLDGPLAVDFSGSDEMRFVFARMLEESRDPALGTPTMLGALMSQCLVLLFRRLCRRPDCPLPWLDALDDPPVAAALDTILAQPGAPHTVASLARHAGMSRSAFAARFAACFGQPPMTFVRDVRLRRAAELLRTTSLPIDTVARRVGFASRSHFSTAFHTHLGRSPAAFRAMTS